MEHHLQWCSSHSEKYYCWEKTHHISAVKYPLITSIRTHWSSSTPPQRNSWRIYQESPCSWGSLTLHLMVFFIGCHHHFLVSLRFILLKYPALLCYGYCYLFSRFHFIFSYLLHPHLSHSLLEEVNLFLHPPYWTTNHHFHPYEFHPHFSADTPLIPYEQNILKSQESQQRTKKVKNVLRIRHIRFFSAFLFLFSAVL